MASGGEGKDSKENKEKCGDCGQMVTSREKGIQCEICDKWFHAKCQCVSDETYKQLQKSQGLHWFCKSCDKVIVQLWGAVTTLQKKQETMEAEMTEIGKEMKRLNGEIHGIRIDFEKKIKEGMKGLEEKVKKMNSDDIKNSQEEIKRLIDEGLQKFSERTEESKPNWKEAVAKELDDRFLVLSAD